MEECGMTGCDVKRLALVLSVQAEIEGMKALNTYRTGLGQGIAYTDEAFFEKAEELRILSSKHDEQL
jgi:hypothetical protein